MPFSALLKLLVLALELWVQRESRREELQLDADEKEWNRLRELGTVESTLAADRLRKRIVRGAAVVGKVNDLPNSDSTTAKGTVDNDQGRSLHSSTG